MKVYLPIRTDADGSNLSVLGEFSSRSAAKDFVGGEAERYKDLKQDKAAEQYYDVLLWESDKYRIEVFELEGEPSQIKEFLACGTKDQQCG